MSEFRGIIIFVNSNQGCDYVKKGRFAALIGAAVIGIGASFAAGTAFASTEPDPLITLSYLEQIAFPKFKEEILASVKLPEAGAPAGQQSNVYTVIELSKDQTLTANSVCEFIVRPGSDVVCVSPFPEQGIADITLGKEVLNGEKVAINSYCLIPRGGDGRGFKILSDKAFIMIRGDYTIG